MGITENPTASTPPSEPALPPAVPQPPPAAPAVHPELVNVIDSIVVDLSGVYIKPSDLLRYIPQLAAKVHALSVSGAQKTDLVVAAAHALVNRVVVDDDRVRAHEIVDMTFPPAIAAVIDVVKGRVSFEQAVVAALQTSAPQLVPVVPHVRNCLLRIFGLCKK